MSYIHIIAYFFVSFECEKCFVALITIEDSTNEDSFWSKWFSNGIQYCILNFYSNSIQ